MLCTLCVTRLETAFVRTFDAFLQRPNGFVGSELKPKRRASGFALLALKPGEVRVHLGFQRIRKRADVDDDRVSGHRGT